MSFYNGHARFVMCSGLFLRERCENKPLKIGMAQKRNIRAILIIKKYDSLQIILRQTELNTYSF